MEVRMGYNILGCLKFIKNKNLDIWYLGNVIEEFMKIPLHTILCTVYEFEHGTLLTMKACILYKYFVKMPYNFEQNTNFMIVCTTHFPSCKLILSTFLFVVTNLEEKIYSNKANHIFGSSRNASKNHDKFLFYGNYGLEIHIVDFLRPTKIISIMTMLTLEEGKKVCRPSNSCNMKSKFMHSYNVDIQAM